MATVSAPNRSFVAVAFLVGGALQVLGGVVGLASSGSSAAGNSGGFYLLSNLALGAGFVLLFAWFATTTGARVAYFLAAIGWLLLALTSLLNLGYVGQIAVFIAIIGTIFAGVMVILARPFRALSDGRTTESAAGEPAAPAATPAAGQVDVLFFVALLVGAVNLLFSQNGNVPEILRALVVVAFGVLLVVVALMLLGRELPGRVLPGKAVPGDEHPVATPESTASETRS